MRTPALLVSALAAFALAHGAGVAQGSDAPTTAIQKIVHRGHKGKRQSADPVGVIQKIADADQERQIETDRLLITALFDVAQAPACGAAATPLLDEWRKSGTVEGAGVANKPGAQAALATTPTVRIVGIYGYPLSANLLTPAAYLSSGEFDKALIVAAPGRTLEWYGRLMAGLPDRSVLVAFQNDLGAPDFDGVKQFIEAFRAKIWAVAPTWNKVSNVRVWNVAVPRGVDVPDASVDPGYSQTTRHIWSMTNFINKRWAEIPIVILVCENRYTNGEFVQALGFAPSAFLWKVDMDYQWGSGKTTPSKYARSHFKLSGREAIDKYAAGVPIFLFGQAVRLGKSPAVVGPSRREGRLLGEAGAGGKAPKPLTRADAALQSEAQQVFPYVNANGYAGACLYIK